MIKSWIKQIKLELAKREFEKSDTVIFYLTKRGFFSEINNLIFAIYFCEINNKKIIIDNSYFVYEWDDSKQCIFKCQYNFVKNSSKKYEKKILREFFNSYIWSYIRSDSFKCLLKNKFVIEKLIDIQNKLYIFQDSLTFECSNYMNGQKYVGLHIRRGDKVSGDSKEADKIDLEKYISLIPEKFKNLPIFVVTDDESVINDLKNLCYNNKIYSFFDKSNIRKDEISFQKANKEYIKRHTINFLRDIDLLIKSECFIGSYSSNVGRFIALKRNFEESYSVDCEWYEMH